MAMSLSGISMSQITSRISGPYNASAVPFHRNDSVTTGYGWGNSLVYPKRLLLFVAYIA